jgi:hypothetical protein
MLALVVRGRALWLFGGLAVLTGCGVLQDPRTCEEPSPLHLQAPALLSATGLYADTGKVAGGVVSYRPRFELWSDGATKQRWAYLPPGAQIDTSDMDAWQFPKGTKLWKEFSSKGIRVETRFLYKIGDASEDWVALAYVWNADGTDAVATPAGRMDARGTTHDVPPARLCMGCHGGTASRVLGFSAIQLAHPESSRPTDMTLARLEREHRLSRPAPLAMPIPGDPTEQAALEYLHANCSHCHNAHRPAQSGERCFDPRKRFDLSLRVGELSSTWSTPVYRTAIGRIIAPGDPDRSALLERLEGDTVESRMPALGTETIDPNAVALFRRWIRELD